MGSYDRIEYKAGDDIGNGLTMLDPTRVKALGTGGKLEGVMVQCWCGLAFLCPVARLTARRGHDMSCSRRNPHPPSQDRLRVNEQHAEWVRDQGLEKAPREPVAMVQPAVRADTAWEREQAEKDQALKAKLDTFAPLVVDAVEAFRRDWRYSEELARAAFKLRGKDPLGNEEVTVTA